MTIREIITALVIMTAMLLVAVPLVIGEIALMVRICDWVYSSITGVKLPA